MSQMLPEGGEVMRRAACGDVCPAPAPLPTPCTAPTPLLTLRSENKELLRQQLLSASKERLGDKSEQPKQKQTRNRQKNRWKLKFHHQALPQEYLDHYEQSLQKVNAKQTQTKVPKPTEKSKAESSVDQKNVNNDSIKIWAQRIVGAQSDPTSVGMAAVGKLDEKKKRTSGITPSKIMTYEDLPYMGEMTLNNSKPRRGRKPKKADICHLIYENYGTVVPGQPPTDLERRQIAGPSASSPKTDLQNKIISSLLERKTSQENKRRGDDELSQLPSVIPGPLHSDHEPLNLCIRDLHELKIQIRNKFGDIYSCAPDVKREPVESAPTEQPNAISVIRRNTTAPPVESPPSAWPSPSLLPLHPLALHTQLLYYRRLAEAARPAPSTSPSDDPDVGARLVLKQISDLLEPSPGPVPASPVPPEPVPVSSRAPKRKRSAIFVPPVPVRTGPGTPAAEVSICKFKFTGGSKPSLQEKKMLSVDSGGNFTYYDGAGGPRAGPKGYEYLQRRVGAPPTRDLHATAPHTDEGVKKKRKSRKSLQREKLEQTFKEKGFLIQTQQLQSAEGATYCKFRQLRKFTRYLFRSWKDYLPGELEERPGSEGRAGAEDGAGGDAWG